MKILKQNHRAKLDEITACWGKKPSKIIQLKMVKVIRIMALPIVIIDIAV